MIRGNCPKCGSQVFEQSRFEDFGKPQPVKVECWGCHAELRVRHNKARQIVIRVKGGRRDYLVTEYE